MTLNDIFDTDFLSQISGDLTLLQIIMTLAISFGLGLFIFFIYRRAFGGVMYSKTFNLALIALSMVSATMILGISSNVVLSLGTLGALSIVRFRTAIKDPIDVVYMFWAIAMGILTGAGLYLLAAVACVLIGVVLTLFSRLNTKNQPYLLVISFEGEDAENALFEALGKHIGTYRVKSRIKTPSSYELTVEIRTRGDKTHIVGILDALPGVSSVAMVSYDGEFAA